MITKMTLKEIYHTSSCKIVELLSFFFILLLTVLNNMQLMRVFGRFPFQRSFLLLVLLLITSMRTINNLRKGKTKCDSAVLASIVLAVYMAVLVFASEKTENLLSSLSAILVWPAVLSSTSYYILNEHENNQFVDMAAFLSIVMSIIYIYGVQFRLPKMIHDAEAYTAGLNSVFFIVGTLPFFILNKRTIICRCAIIAIVLAIIASRKGVPYLILFALSIYLFFSLPVKKKKFVILSTSIIILIFIVAALVMPRLQEVFARMSNELIEEARSGNGRYDIYSKTSQMILNSNNKQLIFGNGYNAVAKTIGIGAHNDFLEILYNYGLIGLMLYLIFWGALVFRLLRLREQSQAHIVSLIIFFFGSMFSSMVTTQVQMLPLALFWGITSPNNIHAVESTIARKVKR